MDSTDVLAPLRAHRAAAADVQLEAFTADRGPMPALFVSHGGGPLPLADPAWLGPLRSWATSLPRPSGVLVVSAHWESAPAVLSAAHPAGVVYDFGGFDPAFHGVRYATPDATDLARRVTAALGGGIAQHPARGLDHGAWVPMAIMYPAADVPVLQLSLPTDRPADLIDLGHRLRPLRDEGVLVVGSGHMTHGLPYLTRANFVDGDVPSWSSEFDAWAADALGRGDLDELARYATAAPGMPYAHPTVEHYTPLLVALGAATEPAAPPTTRLDGFALGLSRRSVEAA